MGKFFNSQEIADALVKRSSQAINSIFEPFRGGFSYATSEGEKSLGGLVDAAWGGKKGDLTHFKIGNHDLNGGKIAATGVGLGLGYRALSGGGLYRDKDGNTDIAGIPFV